MGRKGPRAKTKIVLKSVNQWEQLGNMHNLKFQTFLNKNHPTGGSTSGPGVTVPNVPNPGSDGGTFEITIVQSLSQETNYARVTKVWVYIQIYLDL